MKHAAATTNPKEAAHFNGLYEKDATPSIEKRSIFFKGYLVSPANLSALVY